MEEYQNTGIITKRRGISVGDEFREILRLRSNLLKAEIPILFRECYDGFTIRYPNVGPRVCFVTQRRLNQGYASGKLDICGLLTPEETEADTGSRMAMAYNLSADEVYMRILRHHEGKS